MGIYEGVCRFTLSALHCSAWVKRCLSVTILWIWTGIAYAIYNKGTKLECIQRDADDLKKIPSHLAIIVRNKKEKLSLDELSRMVVWAFAAGVRTVSLYHPNDALKDQFVLLQKQIVTHHQLMFSPPVPDVQVFSGAILPQDRQDTSGCSSCHTVLVLSSDDGRQKLVTAAADISRSVMKRQLRIEDLDPHLIGTRLTVRNDLPDPDLALVCGDTVSTLGYPPWQLRLTEIQSLPCHQKVTYQDFLGSLQRYASCHQRFGK